jgi:hypothetical protein
MENTSKNPLPNSVPPTDIEQEHKDIQVQLNALLAQQAEADTSSSHDAYIPEPIKEVVQTEVTPAFLGMSSPTQVTAPKPNAPTYVPPAPHISKVEFSPNNFESSKPFVPVPAQKSSHTMLWIIIFLTVVFLALLGGVAYWYLKIYSPQNMIEETASTTAPAGQSVGTTSKTFAVPTRSKDAPFQATTKPQTVKTPEVKEYSVSDREKVSEYIKNNINSLSPRKSSLRFTVTDITFDGPDRAIVSYKNSRSAYSAVAVSYIDSKGNVKVTSFTILEK